MNTAHEHLYANVCTTLHNEPVLEKFSQGDVSIDADISQHKNNDIKDEPDNMLDENDTITKTLSQHICDNINNDADLCDKYGIKVFVTNITHDELQQNALCTQNIDGFFSLVHSQTNNDTIIQKFKQHPVFYTEDYIDLITIVLNALKKFSYDEDTYPKLFVIVNRECVMYLNKKNTLHCNNIIIMFEKKNIKQVCLKELSNKVCEQLKNTVNAEILDNTKYIKELLYEIKKKDMQTDGLLSNFKDHNTQKVCSDNNTQKVCSDNNLLVKYSVMTFVTTLAAGAIIGYLFRNNHSNNH
jgi:hypothetical protein